MACTDSNLASGGCRRVPGRRSALLCYGRGEPLSSLGEVFRHFVDDIPHCRRLVHQPDALPDPIRGEFLCALLAEQGNKGAQELATYWVGQGVGLMNKATTVRDVIYEMAEDFAEAAERLAAAVAE